MVDSDVGPDVMRAALDRASQIGPYFGTDEAVAATGWRPARDLVENDDVLRERVEFARSFLAQRTGGEVELRACASINSLGIASRLVAPSLATACSDGLVARLDLDTVFWRPVDGGPMPVAIGEVSGRSVHDAGSAARALIEQVIAPLVDPVTERYRTLFGVSSKTLWGNVASALNGAAGMVPRDTGIDPRDVVAALLDRAPLTGTGRYVPFEGQRFFVRHNCCLFYRVPAGGTCGDCVLVSEAARHDLWRAALER